MTVYRPDTLQRFVAALPRRIIGTSAQLIYYGTVLAVIYRVYSGDFSAIPWITASPILARLIEAVGGNLLSSVLERVARDDEMGPEDILFRIEQALEGIDAEMRDALTKNTEVMTLIYRLLVAIGTPDGALPDEIAALAALAQPAAVAIPRTPHLLTRIGHQSELRRQINRLGEINRNRKGRTVFLMGRVGSGRAAFAGEVRAEAIARGYRTAAIRFDPTMSDDKCEVNDFLRLGRQRPHVETIFEVFPTTAREAVHRQWTDLIIQLSEAGASSGAAGLADEIESLGRFVRSAARVGPLVITIDNLDWAPGYWIDLLLPIAREIGRELPVLLIVSVESPAALAELHGALHTEPTRLAQKLDAEGTAATCFFDAVDYDDIARYISPATGELASRLAYLSGGDPKTVEIIWQEWVAQGAVVRDGAGRWTVAGPDEQWWVYGDAADQARRLLTETLDGWEEDPPYTLAETEVMLSCAALEGETFTLRAVAAALGMEDDDLTEFIDSYLLAYEDPDDPENNQPGILEDMGFAKVDEFRQLNQYRFARPYLHHVWAKYPPAPERLDEWRRAIPLALEGLYYPYGFRIAGDLSRLFAAAGMTDKADEYRRFGRQQQSLEALRRYIQPMLDGVPENRYEVYRLFDAGFAFIKKVLAQRSDLWPEAYAVARRVGALARRCRDWQYEGEANRLMGWALNLGGRPRRGLFWARRGQSLLVRNGVGHVLQPGFSESDLEALAGLSPALRQDQLHLAAFDGTIGYLLRATGDLTAARPYTERALAIYEKVLGLDHPYVATLNNYLGDLLQAGGDLAVARPYFERSLAINERVLGPDHPDTALSLNILGSVMQDTGDLAAARPYYERALAIRERVLGPDHPDTATSLWWMGVLSEQDGDRENASDYYARALSVFDRRLGSDHPYTQSVRQFLSRVS